MQRLFLFCALALLTFTSCAPQRCDTTIYQRSGRVKPIVAVLPVIDSTGEFSHSWDLAHELTDDMRRKVFDSASLYLYREGIDQEYAYRFNEAIPTNFPVSILKSIGDAQFVVVTELVNHEVQPCENSHIPYSNIHTGEKAAILAQDLRIRVLDVRGDTPHIVLQELLHHDHYIAQPYLNTDYVRNSWGTEAYENTPMGLAHARLIREAVSRIESYVTIAL